MFYNQIQPENEYNVNENYLNFYLYYNDYISNCLKQCELFDIEIIDTLSSFNENIMNKNKDNLSTFLSMRNSIKEQKIRLEKYKNKYFDSAKEVFNQEHKYINLCDSLKKDSDDIKEVHMQLEKLQISSGEDAFAYQIELEKMNRIIEKSEVTYNQLKESFIINEKANGSFINFHFSKISKYFSEHVENLVELCDKLNKSYNNKTKENIIPNTIFENNKGICRLQKEEFINYENYLRNLEIIPKEQKLQENIKNIPNIKENNTIGPFVELNENSNTISSTNSKYLKLIESLLTSKEDISNNDISIAISEIDNNIDKAKEFLNNLLMFYENKNFIIIQCLQNLNHITNFISLIINTLQIDQSQLYSYIFDILSIAEETIYIDPGDPFKRYYLCRLLSSRCVLFTDKSFWMKIIEIQINSLVDIKVKEEIGKSDKNKASNKNSNVVQKIQSVLGTSAYKISQNKKIENEIMTSKIYSQNKPKIAVIVIEDFIQHFYNFNFDIVESIEIIVELSSMYNFNSEYVSYFSSILNSNMFNQKNKKTIKNNINEFIKLLQKEQCVKEKKDIIMLHSIIKFLPLEDLLKGMFLNHNICNNYKEQIYLNALNKYKDCPLNIYLLIWKRKLNYQKYTSSVNYKEIVQQIKEGKITHSSFEIINLDVIRTPFTSDVEKQREQLANILKVISVNIDTITYCQGMNYLCALFLSLLKDEEQVFFFYYSFLKSTQYTSLFINDFSLLKKYYYIFNRLLAIFLPEITMHFKTNNINATYYISSWFITLFANTYQNIENQDKPLILIRIIHSFIMNGWVSIVKTGICLIKHFENIILTLSSEELLYFLLNDIINMDFFQNVNVSHYDFLEEHFTIEDALIENIENEYYIQQRNINNNKK